MPEKENTMSEDIYSQHRFYMNPNMDRAIWIYRVPDPDSGHRLIANSFEKSLLEEALKKCPPTPENNFSLSDAFAYIGTECRQYRAEPEDFAYDILEGIFEKEPVSIGCNSVTMDTLRLYFEARELIDKFCKEEYSTPAIFKDPKKIGLAYTTTGDGQHEIQAYANLPEHQTEVYYDGELIATQEAGSLREYVEKQLTNLEFNELVDIPDWVIAEFTKTGIYDPDFKFMEFEAWGETHEICLEVSTYLYGGGIYLSLEERYDGDLEPYADMTVNLPGATCEKDCAFVDINNFSIAEKLIRSYHLGTPTGRIGQSGYCTYPEYRFNVEEIRKYCINPQDLPETGNKQKVRVPER